MTNRNRWKIFTPKHFSLICLFIYFVVVLFSDYMSLQCTFKGFRVFLSFTETISRNFVI